MAWDKGEVVEQGERKKDKYLGSGMLESLGKEEEEEKGMLGAEEVGRNRNRSRVRRQRNDGSRAAAIVIFPSLFFFYYLLSFMFNIFWFFAY